jgi:hypothetical protein
MFDSKGTTQHTAYCFTCPPLVANSTLPFEEEPLHKCFSQMGLYWEIDHFRADHFVPLFAMNKQHKMGFPLLAPRQLVPMNHTPADPFELDSVSTQDRIDATNFLTRCSIEAGQRRGNSTVKSVKIDPFKAVNARKVESSDDDDVMFMEAVSGLQMISGKRTLPSLPVAPSGSSSLSTMSSSSSSSALPSLQALLLQAALPPAPPPSLLPDTSQIVMPLLPPLSQLFPAPSQTLMAMPSLPDAASSSSSTPIQQTLNVSAGSSCSW